VTPRVSVLILIIGVSGCASPHEDVTRLSVETRPHAADCASQGRRLDPVSGRCVRIPATRQVAAPKPLSPTAEQAASTAKGFPIEAHASIDDRLKGETKLMSGLVALLRSRGYSCAAISSARPLSTSNGFKLTCDRSQYRYDIENDNGSWLIKID
jgi:hypothetical protein